MARVRRTFTPQFKKDAVALLRDGRSATVLIPDRDEPFDLTAEEEELLLASIREADQGRTLEGSELLRSLGTHP